jgi:hypothetical protein
MNTIIECQMLLIEMGYQFEEQIYNDGKNQCSLRISLSKDPCVFINHKEDAGWGRFSRAYCWHSALEWAKERANMVDSGPKRS